MDNQALTTQPITPNPANGTTPKKEPSNSVRTVAAVFAFLPGIGALGIHDFILKEYKKGLIHVAMVVLPLTISLVANLLCAVNDICFYDALGAIVIGNIAMVAWMGSYGWAVFEGVSILSSKEQMSQKQPMTISPRETVVPAQKPVEPEKVVVKDEKNGAYAVLSIMATMIPIVLIAVSFFSSPLLLWVYYMTIGLPMAVMAVVFGVIGLKTRLRWLAIISLCLKIAMIVILIVLMLIPFISVL